MMYKSPELTDEEKRLSLMFNKAMADQPQRRDDFEDDGTPKKKRTKKPKKMVVKNQKK